MPYMTGENETRQPSATKLTADEFLRLSGYEDDGLRHELIDGEHAVTPSPDERHQRVSMDLAVALANHLTSTGAGRVYHAPFDVVLSNHDVVEPDLLVVLSDQLDIIGSQNVRGAPAIVVEILSPGGRHRDEVVKRDLYARAGVREYWIVDPGRDAIIVCRQGTPGTFETGGDLSAAAGDTLMSPLLPGFSVPLARLFDQ